MDRPRRLVAVPRLLVAALLAASFAVTSGPFANPPPAAASTAGSMESSILGWVNAERSKRGLVPLRSHGGLAGIAGDRAATMASTGVMAHTGCLSCPLNARGIQWYGAGEVIAYTTWPWGSQAAKSVFNGWKGSSSHWALLMSNQFNYIGIGVAYRGASSATFAAGVLIESVDGTKPRARMQSVSRSGTTVTWRWTGADTALQTHTAGLRNFDVQYRTDGGSWSTIRKGTAARSLSLDYRTRGHWYGLRVRARDHRGHMSGFTSELRVWVPLIVRTWVHRRN
jgi:uncharacterized protein YkwD